MQIREQGRKIQLIRTYYISEKKRTQGKVFGSFDRKLSEIPCDIYEKLTSEEVEQLEYYLSERERRQDIESLKDCLLHADENIGLAAKALSVDELAASLTLEKAESIFSAIDELKKELKRAGYKRRSESKS